MYQQKHFFKTCGIPTFGLVGILFVSGCFEEKVLAPPESLEGDKIIETSIEQNLDKPSNTGKPEEGKSENDEVAEEIITASQLPQLKDAIIHFLNDQPAAKQTLCLELGAKLTLNDMSSTQTIEELETEFCVSTNQIPSELPAIDGSTFCPAFELLIASAEIPEALRAEVIPLITICPILFPPLPENPGLPQNPVLHPDGCITQISGGPSSCKSETTWKSYATEACLQKEMLLVRIATHGDCEGGLFQEAKYTCCPDSLLPSKPDVPQEGECASIQRKAEGLAEEEIPFMHIESELCMGIPPEKICSEIVHLLQKSESSYGRTLLSKYCDSALKAICYPIYERGLIISSPEGQYYSYEFELCTGTPVQEICPVIQNALSSAPSQYGEDILTKYCSRIIPPKPDPTADKCQSILNLADHHSPEDQMFVKFEYELCSGVPAEKICPEIAHLNRESQSELGSNLVLGPCSDAMKRHCEEFSLLAEAAEKEGSPDAIYYRYERALCVGYPLEKVCPDIREAQTPNPSEYGRQLYESNCVSTPTPKSPCDTIRESGETSPTEDQPYIKPAYYLCIGDAPQHHCDFIKETLDEIPSQYGEAVFEQHCKDIPLVEPSAACLETFNVWMIFMTCKIPDPDYAAIKEKAHDICGEQISSLTKDTKDARCEEISAYTSTLSAASPLFTSMQVCLEKKNCQ